MRRSRLIRKEVRASRRSGAKQNPSSLGSVLVVSGQGKPTRYLGTRVQDATLMDPETGQGAPFESRVHGAQMAEVEVDTETGKVRGLF